MRLSSLYDCVVKCGSSKDPRKDKKKISGYCDSGILYGNPALRVQKLLVGIDIEVPELLLADRIRQREGLDLVMAHHPEGRPFASLYAVMDLQVDVLKKEGVSADTAAQLMEERMQEVERGLMPSNHTRAVDAARLLDMPFMCVHTPADNHAYWFIRSLMNKKKPHSVGNIVDVLMEFEEYRDAARGNAGPKVILGNPQAQAGRIMVDMTGGTEGHRDVFDKLYKAGVRTLVCMHLSEAHFKKAKDTRLNVVIAGHISSDTLGVNLLLDCVEAKMGERFQVINCSGFKRIKRQ